MRALLNRRDTSSDDDDDSSGSDRDGRLGNAPAPATASTVTTNAPTKRLGAFLKTAAGDDKEKDEEDDEAKILSKYDRCVNRIEEVLQPDFINALSAKDWRKANETWLNILMEMNYVFTTNAKLPYSFLSALSSGEQFFTTNKTEELREEVKREDKKSFSDLVNSITEYAKKYKMQVENMDEDEEDDDYDGGPREGLSAFKEGEEINEETVAKKITEIQNSRGKKGTDKRTYVGVLQSLLHSCAFSPRAQAYVCSLLIAATFDAPRKNSSFSPSTWNRTATHLTQLMGLIEQYPNDVIEEDPEKAAKRAKPAASAPGNNAPPENSFLSQIENFTVKSTVHAQASRLVEEYMDGVRTTEIFADAYLQWLRAESTLLGILIRAHALYNKAGSMPQAVTIASNILGLVYYRKETIHKQLMNQYLPGATGIVTENLNQTVTSLNTFIQKNATSQEPKFLAVLSVVYHLCEHLELESAQTLFGNYKCADGITTCGDHAVRVMYNRCLAALAICLFRKGNINDAGITLSNLYSIVVQGRSQYKELLAQTPPRGGASSAEGTGNRVDKLIRSMFVPWHMHVNIEVTDSIFFIYCMLYQDNNKRRDNKVYRSFVQGYEKQHFLGPPENSREHVFAALCAFRKSDWRNCVEHLKNITCWSSFGESRDFLTPLIQTVKVDCLRNFLSANRGSYANVSIAHLQNKFALPLQTVRDTITRMLLQKEISGILNEAESVLYMDNTQYTKVQQAVLNLADKAILLTDFTERVQEGRPGGAEAGGAAGGRDFGRRAGVRAPVTKQISARGGAFSSLRGVRTAGGPGGRGSGASTRWMGK